MTPLIFKHSNTHREVVVTKEQVFAVQYSKAHDCTHIISSAGAIIPVLQTVAETVKMIYGHTATLTEEK